MKAQCISCGSPCDHRSSSKLCNSCYWPRPDTTVERFWERVTKTDGCWKWNGSQRHKFGYPIAAVSLSHVDKYCGRKQVEAHRLSWVLHFGPIPTGMHVCHTCDNPECTRPEHLFLGTAAANLADMRSKGREARGDTHGSSTHPEAFPGKPENLRPRQRKMA